MAGTIFMDLEGAFDFTVEEDRLKKQLTEIENELKRVEGRLLNEAFLSRAPAEVVQKESAKKEEILQRREKILRGLEFVASHLKSSGQ
jgi:valyl-tRNA synthetase